MSKVIVFGSLNMDLSIESDHMPNLGETIIGRGFITNPGGKGANQAVAAAKMGAAVCMLGAVGADSFGDQMIASLAEHGVTCEYITRSESCPTGVAIITRVCGDNFITIDAGANASTRIDAVRRALDEVAEPGDVFLVQLECDYETTWAALAEARPIRGNKPRPRARDPRSRAALLGFGGGERGRMRDDDGHLPRRCDERSRRRRQTGRKRRGLRCHYAGSAWIDGVLRQ